MKKTKTLPEKEVEYEEYFLVIFSYSAYKEGGRIDPSANKFSSYEEAEAFVFETISYGYTEPLKIEKYYIAVKEAE